MILCRRLNLVLLAATFVFSLLFLNVDGSWVDPDTPERFRKTEALTKGDDRKYELVCEPFRWSKYGGSSCLTFFKSNVWLLQVFSDEFEQDGRTFHDGTDPRWTAINKNDCTYMLTVRYFGFIPWSHTFTPCRHKRSASFLQSQ